MRTGGILHRFGRVGRRGIVESVLVAMALVCAIHEEASSQAVVATDVIVDMNGDGWRERVLLLKADDGSTEVRIISGVSSARIVGFGFDARDPVRMRLTDADGDGDLDILVTNVRPVAWLVATESPPRSGRAPRDGSSADPRAPALVMIVTPPDGFPTVLDIGEGLEVETSTSRLGDRDNFGYPHLGEPAPCSFYDNREPEDLGVFDYELTSGDAVDRWTHTFAVHGRAPTRVKLTTWEIFSDFEASTIDLDGHTFNFADEPFAVCDAYPIGGFKRSFVLTGADSGIAADGSGVVTFREIGDDISLDRAVLEVRY